MTLKGIKDTSILLTKINNIGKFDDIATKTSQLKKLKDTLKETDKVHALFAIRTSNLNDINKVPVRLTVVNEIRV